MAPGFEIRPFALRESEHGENCRGIAIEGELDFTMVDQLRGALEHAGRDGCGVLIGLERCDFIDSSVITEIVRARNTLERDGRGIALYGCSDQIIRILTLSGLVAAGLVHETEQEALDSLAG